MKRILIFCVMAALPALFCLSCGSSQTETKTQQAPAREAKYVCPMHPQVTSDVPGTCTECGMQLEPVHKADSAKASV